MYNFSKTDRHVEVKAMVGNSRIQSFDTFFIDKKGLPFSF